MRLVYKYTYNGNEKDKLLRYCTISKNLYNQALYYIRQTLKNENRFVFYNELDKVMKTMTNLDGEINYRLMPKAQSAQQCLKVLDKSIKSYVKSIKDWKHHKDKYKGMPKLPNYKKQVNQLILTSQCCQIKDSFVYLHKDLKIHIPQWDKYKNILERFQQVRINPLHDGNMFVVEIIYEKDILNSGLNAEEYASIDLGVDNFVTLIDGNNKPLLYNGKQIKSINQMFNKRLSFLKSRLEKCNGRKTSKGIRKLYEKRNDRLGDLMHKVSRHIVDYLLDNGIGNIVVGYNKGWKDSINIGKRNNQTFVSIPYDKFISYLRYKCELCGIRFILNEESYTSKCDSLAMETIEKHDEYLGTRIKRGLYQSSKDKLINADVNGALNILRKVVDDSEIISRIINRGLLFNHIKQNNLYCLF